MNASQPVDDIRQSGQESQIRATLGKRFGISGVGFWVSTLLNHTACEARREFFEEPASERV